MSFTDESNQREGYPAAGKGPLTHRGIGAGCGLETKIQANLNRPYRRLEPGGASEVNKS